MNALPDNHLDLGCGVNPRNPYGRKKLFGIDVRDDAQSHVSNFKIVKCNAALEPIPFEDNHFGSISAFDFLEHVPRQLYSESSKQIFYPFVNLMSEIWRVLAPGGRLLAVTPAFPASGAFVDPTHVNIITDKTHQYFCGATPMARAYGFKGEFKVKMAKFTAMANVSAMPPPAIWRQWLRNLHRRMFKDGLHHVVWELEAVKKI